jgi:hypothetical protein
VSVKTVEELTVEIEELEEEFNELLDINWSFARINFTTVRFIEALGLQEPYEEFLEDELLKKELAEMGFGNPDGPEVN